MQSTRQGQNLLVHTLRTRTALYHSDNTSNVCSEAAILQFYFESFDYHEVIVFVEGIDIFLCKKFGSTSFISIILHLLFGEKPDATVEKS